MNFPKKTAWALLWFWAWYHLADNYAPEVLTATSDFAGWVHWLIETASNGINTVTEVAIGTAAPFAFPMVAGWYLGKKVADSMKIESTTLRRAASVAGAWIWAWVWYTASASILAPYLTVAWVWYAGYKGFQGLKYIWRKAVWWVKGAYNGVVTA